MVRQLADIDGPGGTGGPGGAGGLGGTDGRDDLAVDRELLAQLHELERVKAVAAAAQARITVAFQAVQQRRVQAARDRARTAGTFEAWQAARPDAGAGVGEQVALARRLSPWHGQRALALANRLVADLPCTLRALQSGAISEWRAVLIARATSHLSSTDQQAVDAECAADPHALTRLGDRELVRVVTAAAYRRDPHGAVARARTAETARRVWSRPAPDTMCQVGALLPVAQGVAVVAALNTAASTAAAAGDPRTRGQVMADTLVERVTGQAHAAAVPVEVQVVLTDATLLGTGPGADDPAQIPGYGSVPAGWVRDLLRADTPTGPSGVQAPMLSAAQVWLRRLYSTPEHDALVAMDSTRRLFDAGLRRFVIARDNTCRTPWCDAPIRHLDHVHDHADGGPTSGTNGQGLCQHCNHTKQLPDWHTEVLPGPAERRHEVRWRTPTALTYDGTAPPLLPGSTASGSTASGSTASGAPPGPVSVIESLLARMLAA
jgi:hypothetical protein